MGNFEKLSVLVIVVIIVMILVVALYTWQTDGEDSATAAGGAATGSGSALIGTPLMVGEEGGAGAGTSALGASGRAGAEGSAVRSPSDYPDVDELYGRDAGGEESADSESSHSEHGNSDGRRDDEGRTEEEGTEGGETVGSGGERGGEEGAAKGSEPAPGTDTDWIYTIKSGDTISQISERELGTIRRQKEIFQRNPGLDPRKIRAGDQLKMPPRGRTGSIRVVASEGKGASRAAGGAHARGGRIAAGEFYVIQTGDRLQTISTRAYGNPERWPELWARNLSVIPSIDDELTPGTKIFIPK